MSGGQVHQEMDLATLRAIDVHVHVQRSSRAQQADVSPQLKQYFGNSNLKRHTAGEVATYYRERHMACVAFTVDRLDRVSDGQPSNEEIADVAAQNADVMIPFASVHPARGERALDAVDRLTSEYGVRGFKFHPITQRFWANDRDCFPMYERIEAAGSIALFHTGQTGIGSGESGGGGYLLKYGNPMAIDEVAATFPGMQIVMAHPAFPWQDEALAVALHKPNVHIDLSGWSPKYFSAQLIRYADTLLREKVLFGSDFPLITPDRWLQDFDDLPFRETSRRAILLDNAARLFGLVPPADQSSS